MAEDTIRSADVMAERLKDPAKVDEIRSDPNRINAMAADAKAATDANFQAFKRANALEADRVVYRMTTMFLGGAVLVIAIGIIVIRLAPLVVLKDAAAANVVAFQIPESLVAIASTAVGALAGLLSPLGNRSN